MTKTVVITGASAGIGRATARLYGGRGANVGLIARVSPAWTVPYGTSRTRVARPWPSRRTWPTTRRWRTDEVLPAVQAQPDGHRD